MPNRKYTVDYNQAGYAGDAMSIGAVQAYREGAMPMSRWTKAALTERIVELGGSSLCGLYTAKELRERFLVHHSWHHTGIHANRTDFFCIDEARALECTDQSMRTLFSEEKADRYLARLHSTDTAGKKSSHPKDTWVSFNELPEHRVEYVRTSRNGNRIVSVRCIDSKGDEYTVEGVERHLAFERFRIPFEEHLQPGD